MRQFSTSAYRILGVVAIMFALATSAHAQSCATPGPTDLYVDKDNSGASDSNNGHYTKDGGTGPFKTIQRLIDLIQPGQCGFVRQSASPYYENTYRAGDYWGVTFTHGGTSDTARLVVAGYPGEHPVLDQQRAAPAGSAGYSVGGFFVYSGSYITIRNFEVRNTIASGIMTNPSGGPWNYITIEGNHVHNMAGTGNPNNVGGIRLDHCFYCEVRNNVVNNIGDDQGADGINAFEPGGCTLENNLIYNVSLGVQLKQANSAGLPAHTVRNNIFVNLDTAYKMQVRAAASLPAAHNAQFYNNVVFNARQGVWVDLADAGEQATSLKIYNNTFINTGELATIDNMTGMEIYNNIYDGNSGSFIFNTKAAGQWKNQVSYFDNNLYFNVTPYWEIETYNNPSTYKSLDSWRTATREVTTPDLKSLFSNPLFVSSGLSSANLLLGSVSDYALSASSPGLKMGRYADTVGAVRSGVLIGPQLGPLPMAPALSVN
jgi:hypothetical protein